MKSIVWEPIYYAFNILSRHFPTLSVEKNGDHSDSKLAMCPFAIFSDRDSYYQCGAICAWTVVSRKHCHEWQNGRYEAGTHLDDIFLKQPMTLCRSTLGCAGMFDFNIVTWLGSRNNPLQMIIVLGVVVILVLTVL